MTGVTVKLWERTQKTEGTPPVPVFDEFNDPVWTYKATDVANVLIGQPTTDEVTSGIDLYGKKAEFMLGIPKGDTHAWEDARVEFFGRSWQTFGMVLHHKVRVARYE